jgi:hypothetical protein
VTDTEFKLILLGVVALIIVAAMFLYRKKFSLKWKIFGSKLELSGENESSPPASGEAVAGSQGDTAVATGDRAVAIEGGAAGATIVTGDNATVTSGERPKDKP